MTRIEQLQKTGIIRTGSPKRGFTYKKADGAKVSAADLSRIGELVIPPAWTEVAINGCSFFRMYGLTLIVCLI
jgi:DNA topoisomerase-1